ncbi:MAG: hypothetical protein MMC33_000540 [Icmadophila ericetorum]|nr:hypothetical protein [Icmadophila ericetorum]
MATLTGAKILNTPIPGQPYAPKIQIRLILLRPLTHELPLFYLSKENYYFLPSGPLLDTDTSDLPALERLALKETRCKVAINGNDMRDALVGVVEEEHRGGVHLISYCYWGLVSEEEIGIGSKKDGENGAVGEEDLRKMDVDGEELEGLCWFTLSEAVEVLSAIKPKTEKGRRIQEGDLFLIERVMEKLGLVKGEGGEDVEVEIRWSEMDDIS